MKISVLLPAYNAEKYILETLQSIISQTYGNFELLISDDCSTDNTRKIIDEFKDSRIRRFHNSVNIKKPLTVQKLFEHSSGDLITIHDADDISLPYRFEKIVKKFGEFSDIGMCGHIIERISNKGKPLGLYREKVEDYNEIRRFMITFNTDGDPSIFVRRNVLEELSVIFRPYFQNNMDYDLALRIIEKFRTTNILEVLSYYRNVPGSISKNILDYKKLTTQKMTQFFAQERKNTGSDALMRNEWDLIRKKELEFSQKYVDDNTLHFREMAAFFMYCRMNLEAIKYMIYAVKIEPFKFINWRTLQYCVRKTLIGV